MQHHGSIHLAHGRLGHRRVTWQGERFADLQSRAGLPGIAAAEVLLQDYVRLPAVGYPMSTLYDYLPTVESSQQQ